MSSPSLKLSAQLSTSYILLHHSTLVKGLIKKVIKFTYKVEKNKIKIPDANDKNHLSPVPLFKFITN